MGVRYGVVLLAVSLLGGLDSTYGQCPRECCAAGREVIVEVRMATIRTGFCERVLADVKPGPDGLRTLTDQEKARLLEAIEGDPRACVMMAPKITAADGQTAYACIAEHTTFITSLKAIRVGKDNVLISQEEQVETGIRLKITPKTSADGRVIRLTLDAESRILGPCGMVPVMTQIHAVDTGKSLPFTQYLQVPQVNTRKTKALAVVPAGGSVIIPGPIVEREEQTECRVPVLSDIPYVDRLFTNVRVCKVPEQTVLVISARWVPEQAAGPLAMPAEMPSSAARVVPAGHTEQALASETRNVAGLMKAYRRACAAGDKNAAMRYAVQALALDPTCFGSGK